jgi:glyoxylase-like metal-dependent hydrolase (beta-lactamase superfamily II)
MEVVPSLHYLEAIPDTKVYVWIEGDRAVIVDAATPGRAGAVWAALETMVIPRQSVAQIWLTHGDIDHIGSAGALKAGTGAQVVAHQDDVPLIEGRATRELGPVRGVGILQWLATRLLGLFMRSDPVTVDLPIEDGDMLGRWRVVHTPGHTAGSVCFFHPERRIAIVGDAINHRGGVLRPPPAIFTPDMKAAHESVRRIAELDFDVCCFGHGPPLMVDARERVQDLAESLQAG